jgi:hypothetical protein
MSQYVYVVPIHDADAWHGLSSMLSDYLHVKLGYDNNYAWTAAGLEFRTGKPVGRTHKAMFAGFADALQWTQGRRA